MWRPRYLRVPNPAYRTMSWLLLGPLITIGLLVGSVGGWVALLTHRRRLSTLEGQLRQLDKRLGGVRHDILDRLAALEASRPTAMASHGQAEAADHRSARAPVEDPDAVEMPAGSGEEALGSPVPLGADTGDDGAVAVVFERAANPASTRSLHSLAMQLGRRGETSSEAVLNLLVEQRTVGMAMIDPSGVFTRVNHALADTLALGPDALVGRSVRDVVHPEDYESDLVNGRRLLRGGMDHHVSEVRLVRSDSSLAWARSSISVVRDEDGGVVSLIAQIVDISRERRAEDFMSRRTLYDPLTQLMNRMLLIDLLGDSLRVRQRPLAVVALNLDRFKAVNDSLGQSTGDAVLKEVADRLRLSLQPGDYAARISGDDFVMLVSDVGNRARADAVTQRILDLVAEPIEIDGLRIQLSASAGVTLVQPGSGLSGDEVITQATAALKRAKDRGRARWEVFDAEMRSATLDRLRIETSLRKAIEDRRLVVAYQPVVELAEMRTDGAEALLRWRDKTLGNVAPPIFLPVAEESGLIVPLGEFVLTESVKAAAQWRARAAHEVHVAVNLSPHQLNRPGMAAHVAEVLDTHDLPPEALRLEITESVLVEAGAQVRQNLADLRALGIALGIDDFGTGYASMAYLKSLPVDFVKIDKSFVGGLGTSREDTAICKAVLALAKSLDLVTVAEGIEKQSQLEMLTELGCELGQGYLLGHPDTQETMSGRLG